MNVPAPLLKLWPYAKTVVAVAGVAATVVVALVASPPSWAYMIIAAATALGVRQVPNKQVVAVLQDGLTAVRAGEAAVSDARAGNLPAVGNDVTQALSAVKDADTQAVDILKELRNQ